VKSPIGGSYLPYRQDVKRLKGNNSKVVCFNYNYKGHYLGSYLEPKIEGIKRILKKHA
jgi:hypothetical protein